MSIICGLLYLIELNAEKLHIDLGNFIYMCVILKIIVVI
jgi:hypothetical protein